MFFIVFCEHSPFYIRQLNVTSKLAKNVQSTNLVSSFFCENAYFYVIQYIFSQNKCSFLSFFINFAQVIFILHLSRYIWLLKRTTTIQL